MYCAHELKELVERKVAQKITKRFVEVRSRSS